MRILFVHPATTMSIGDVARGYRRALEKQGEHEIADYYLERRLAYHLKALTPDLASQPGIPSKLASETLAVEAMYFNPDIVIAISGLNLHPVAFWLLAKLGVPSAVILTESPYDDDQQRQWLNFDGIEPQPNITVFSNDNFSAKKYGWNFLAPSFDPITHYPCVPEDEDKCDVFMVGTGWDERQQFLEAVDWTGIDLRLYGIWPNLNEGSQLFKFYKPYIVNNEHVRGMYCGAKVNLNIHRKHPNAETPGPRVYEVAACGAFQLSDPRKGLDVFNGGVPTFTSPTELGDMVRYYLANEGERKLCAARTLDAVCDEDFDKRAGELVDALTAQPVHT